MMMGNDDDDEDEDEDGEKKRLLDSGAVGLVRVVMMRAVLWLHFFFFF